MKKKIREFEIAKNTHLQLSDLNNIMTQNFKSTSNYLEVLDKRLEMLSFTENLMLDFVFQENFTLEDLNEFSNNNIKDNSLKRETIEFLQELQQLENEEDIEDEN